MSLDYVRNRIASANLNHFPSSFHANNRLCCLCCSGCVYRMEYDHIHPRHVPTRKGNVLLHKSKSYFHKTYSTTQVSIIENICAACADEKNSILKYVLKIRGDVQKQVSELSSVVFLCVATPISGTSPIRVERRQFRCPEYFLENSASIQLGKNRLKFANPWQTANICQYFGRNFQER